MVAKKILFSTDFSTCGDAALNWATSLARDTNARLLILHVQEPPIVYGYGAAYYGVVNPDLDQQREMLEKVVPKDPSVSFEHHLVEGTPAEAIVRFADREGVDLIVMGTHGRTGISRALMGSVAEAVVRHASCPVLTFRQPEDTSSQEQK